ncbi:MAG: UTP--glucose-1-phosphate uridylyltransferase AglF [Candidatus Methanophagaceae archaeon]|nr:MAG: UTP--glucose-1-phosphate uridylyltransferase AglF [Methanophagales archaeon]
MRLRGKVHNRICLFHELAHQFVIANIAFHKFILEAGVDEIGIIVGPNKEQVMATVQSQDWDAEIVFIPQDEPRGLAHTILIADKFLDDEFVMYLGDNILREG